MRNCILLAAALLALPAFGVERDLSFTGYPLEETPTNFHSTLSGQGKPGNWKIILDDAPSAMPSRGTNAPSPTQRAVLAQLARDPANEHFPLLVLKDDTYADFKFTARFKIIGGALAQMAGIVFRYQDEKNYYVLMASALDKHFWFFKVVNGQRSDKLIGPQIDITKNEWREISVECEGNHIQCRLDGKDVIPMITDSSFGSGKIGFWTKSDSVSYFADGKVTFTPREILAQSLVNDALQKFPKLVGLKIFSKRPGSGGPVVVASNDAKQLNQPGTDVEKDVIANGKGYYGKDKKAGTVTVTLPLRDRNGDAIGAVVVVMNSFPGETEDTAALKAKTVIKSMEPHVPSLEDLLQ